MEAPTGASESSQPIAHDVDGDFGIGEEEEIIVVRSNIDPRFDLKAIAVEGKVGLEEEVVQPLLHGIVIGCKIRDDCQSEGVFVVIPLGSSQL